mmetsp:Transcript_127143/g.220411  ORF Transcript_127143/g.220411 Transcript_127143/m.220411 type:complete len:356 (-) Transcript_127143:69-1136(-)
MAAVDAMDVDDRRFSASTACSDRDLAGGCGVESGRSSMTVTPDLQAKANQKVAFVQQLVRNLERAITNMQPEDQEYLHRFLKPDDPCFATLCNLLLARKYSPFVLLRCVVLRAIQMILKIAVSVASGEQPQAADIGMRVFEELAGKQLAPKVYNEVYQLSEHSDQAIVAVDAMLVLTELGPEAFGVRMVERLLDLFELTPDRASELTEVALRVHAWGDPTRSKLLEVTLSHRCGTSLVEVLLQMVNRSDQERSLRAVKVLTGCLLTPAGQNLLYTNDAHVLVEILLRELPDRVASASEFSCFAECLRALEMKCKAARDHRRAEVIQILEDLRDDERTDSAARGKCMEVLAVMASA